MLTRSLFMLVMIMMSCAAIADFSLHTDMDLLERPRANFDLMPLSNSSTRIEMTAAKDDSLSLSLKIKSKISSKVSIRLSNFKNIETGRFVGDKEFVVKVKYVARWYQAAGAWKKWWIEKNSPTVLIPELLVNDLSLVQFDRERLENKLKLDGAYYSQKKLNQFSNKSDVLARDFPFTDSNELQPAVIDKSNPLHIWINVAINKEGIAGRYEANVIVESANKKTIVGVVAINVLTATLPVSKYTHGVYYRGKLTGDNKAWISSEFKSEQQLDADLKDIYGHGINTVLIYQPIEARKKYKNYLPSEIDELFEKYLTIKRRYDEQSPELFYLGIVTANTKNMDAYRSRLSKLKRLASQHGYNDIYIYGIDEAEGKELIQQQSMWTAAHQESVKIIAAGKKGLYYNMYDYGDAFIIQDKRGVRRKGQKRLLEYSNPQAGVENPYYYRYRRGLRLWQNDYDGSVDYAYQHAMGFAWDDGDHKTYRDHLFTYPSASGPISTIAWEGLAMGINDLRYIQLLESCLKLSPSELASSYLSWLKIEADPDFASFRKNVTNHIQSVCMVEGGRV
mgnify:FL=1